MKRLIATYLLVLLSAPGLNAQDVDPVNNVIEYPIKLLSTSTVTRTIYVEFEKIASITGLYFEIHSLSGVEQGEVRLNGGSWIAINNTNATCLYPDSKWECIAGAFDVVHFYIPMSGFVEGSNQIDFRYTRSASSAGFNSMGYRVLRVDSWPRGHSTTRWVEEDPTLWQPPLPSASDIAAGLTAFTARNTLIDQPGGVSIKAACSDCHSFNGTSGSSRVGLGYDLDYFAFSNESIEQRSLFHGLSETEAKQIASYIRSLASPRPGRPWDPPFQPGPGLDSKSAGLWTAGAGYEWSLTNDIDGMGFMYPDGILRPLRSNTNSTLNLREIPINMQFEDWNGWLPITHPMDHWYNKDSPVTLTTKFEQSSAWTRFNGGSLFSTMSGSNSTQKVGQIDAWAADYAAFRRDLDNYRTAFNNHPLFVTTRRDLSLWHASQEWGVMRLQEGTLANLAYPDTDVEKGEARSWVAGTRTIFDIAPHISGEAKPPQYACCAPYPTVLQNLCATHRWYGLQMIVNAGNRFGGSISPVDWKYQYGFLKDCAGETGDAGAIRVARSYLKNMQQEDRLGANPSINEWYMRNVTLGRIFRGSEDILTGSSNGAYFTLWSQVPQDMQAEILEASLRGWLRKTLEYPTTAWQRGFGGGAALEPATYTPVPWTSGAFWGEPDGDFADTFYRAGQLSIAYGIRESLVDSLANWGESMWPLGNWEALLAATPATKKAPVAFNFSVANHPTNASYKRVTLNFTTASSQTVTLKALQFAEKVEVIIWHGTLGTGNHSYTLDVPTAELGLWVARLTVPTDMNYSQDRQIR